MPIFLLLADHQLLFRRAIRELLSTEDIAVSGEASDGREAVQLAAKIQPDVAVLDVFMPLLNSLDVGKEILHVSPRTRILLLSFSLGSTYLRNALSAGVSGFVSKAGAAATLEYAVRRVAAGSIYLDPLIGSTMSEAESQNAEDDRMPLTARERQVVQLVADCRTTKEIASLLGISTKTVESHRQRAMAKLNLTQLAQLVRYAIRKDLVEVRIPPPACGGDEEGSVCSDTLTLIASVS
jgi:DNA-binding NarL/FixJ family response regulator